MNNNVLTITNILSMLKKKLENGDILKDNYLSHMQKLNEWDNVNDKKKRSK